MDRLAHFLKNDLQISDHRIPQIMEFYSLEAIPKKKMLIEKGQYRRKMYLIEEGYLRFFYRTEKKVVTHWIFGKGQLVTDIASFFLNEPAKCNIQALTDCKAYTLTYENYQLLRNQIPEWDEQEKTFLVKLMSGLENRVFGLISMTAEERYQYLFESDSAMFNELPLQYLASMLGMTPETLSRLRAKSNS